ncbi:geranyl-CoA carboxylase beta subunit [Roseiarcus fermentans]|uniref:Geranyl-CoA carboxylase beta subunit n=1 Tax=Roseiarcus fermentans TaxID=1473586 RepID=A0A366EKJ2_9HYPH|nr:carboxyl transferase domain-containing protein [Roseiarcus fermentans]RBP02878.1 geranyl-CoA carboxylase beta subunit [Roseiarcus fermentans]
MPAIASNVIVESEAFRANRIAHLELIAGFRDLERKVRAASGRADEKFRSRGQLPPRERLNWLLDRESAFLELSTLCGLGMHEDDGRENVYGGGLIAGIGFVSGVRCLVAANDSGIKGGAAHPMGVEKAIRAQEIALREKLPYVQLVESAGANLLLQAEMFVRGGATFANMARMSAAGIPVISIVHGSSTAGGAYQTGLADYVVMVRGRSKVFLAGPPLLKAATGEIAADEALGGAELHSVTTGLAEYLAEDDADALRIGREILARVVWSAPPPRPRSSPPLYDPEELLGVVPVDYRKPYDVREVIARVVDGSEFLDFKPGHGPATVCGHAAIEGRGIGLVGNNGPIDSAGAGKAAQFIQLCCQAGLPIVFLQNTTGYLVGVEAESSGIVKHGSKMIQAVTNASVPKLTLQIGGSFGAGHYGMCGRSFGPRFVFSWPNARVAVMGGEQAARVMAIVAEDSANARGQPFDEAKTKAMGAMIVAGYDKQSTALFATARLWDDGLIDPRDSRSVLSFCLDTCAESDARALRPNAFGVARF